MKLSLIAILLAEHCSLRGMSVRFKLAAALLFVGLSGCSTSGGIGFAHHPLDCAMGIQHPDCLPGTAGYNNGGGQQTRIAQADEQRAEFNSQISALASECKASLEMPNIDPIRTKVEIVRDSPELPPPFAIAANTSFPSASELPAIAAWIELRESCQKKVNEFYRNLDNLNSTSNLVLSMQNSLAGRVSELAVSLYQQKITYGEFAQKRYELSRDEQLAEKQVLQDAAIVDQQTRLKAIEIAQRNNEARIEAWQAYIQSVAARQPRTVIVQQQPSFQQPSVHCTSNAIGSMVDTNCN